MSWLGSSVNWYLAAEPEVRSLISRHASCEVEPTCAALGNLHSPRVSPEEGNDQPILRILYLENSIKAHHESELT